MHKSPHHVHGGVIVDAKVCRQYGGALCSKDEKGCSRLANKIFSIKNTKTHIKSLNQACRTKTVTNSNQ